MENLKEYTCDKCGAGLLPATVSHPIYDGLFPLSGSGKCQYETVFYCPNCEKKPSFHGFPVYEERFL